jgi:hypothetical protein
MIVVTRISSSFMADYKLWDNITYNISIMKVLRQYREDGKAAQSAALSA